ncbi:hypothetical protein [Janibacter massiliensis]|uniref:hypothetical protein n=1 Tax=Janibacter massiliensis TaxID=2058291 RepID=UPI00131A5701|nr:hypothetical protein [Janibacter massiliensis]
MALTDLRQALPRRRASAAPAIQAPHPLRAVEQAHTDVERMPDHGTAQTALAPRQIDRTRPAGNRIYIHANTLIVSRVK